MSDSVFEIVADWTEQNRLSKQFTKRRKLDRRYPSTLKPKNDERKECRRAVDAIRDEANKYNKSRG